MKVTVQDIKDHYLGNLQQLALFGECVELRWKVKKVKDKKDFVDFMVKKYNQWEVQVNVLDMYFVIKDNAKEYKKKTGNK